MAKKPILHSYSDYLAFQRLMLIIATLLQHPGIGYSDLLIESKPGNSHNALEAVQTQLQKLADSLGIELPAGYPTIPTIRKDLETLKNYTILERHIYRWGYYLGTGVMSREELKIAFNSLQSQAEYQGHPQVRQVYQTIKKRLRGLVFEEQGDFFYPVRAYLDRPIIYTDPQEIVAKGKFRHNLFFGLELVEKAIATGQSIELYRNSEPYNDKVGYLQVYPLQLFYHNIAWYLLYEECNTEHLAVERVDRFKNYSRIIDLKGRGEKAQWKSLNLALKLMSNGWGIYLGQPDEQQLEREEKLEFKQVKVRFYPPVATFILEGESRHHSQKVYPSSKDSSEKYSYVDYVVKLPPRSFHEFSRWIYTFMGNALVLSPPELVEKHHKQAQALVERYSAP